MTRPISKDTDSGADRYVGPVGEHVLNDDLEVIMKSGGAYCLAKKSKHATGDCEHSPADHGADQGVIACDDDDGEVEDKEGRETPRKVRSRWFKWIPGLTKVADSDLKP